MLKIFQLLRRRRLAGIPNPSPMRIVCGDCGGDETTPHLTILMSDGTCAKCAGRSFVCAERLSMVLARHLLSQTTEVKK